MYFIHIVIMIFSYFVVFFNQVTWFLAPAGGLFTEWLVYFWWQLLLLQYL